MNWHFCQHKIMVTSCNACGDALCFALDTHMEVSDVAILSRKGTRFVFDLQRLMGLCDIWAERLSQLMEVIT